MFLSRAFFIVRIESERAYLHIYNERLFSLLVSQVSSYFIINTY